MVTAMTNGQFTCLIKIIGKKEQVEMYAQAK